MKEKKGQERGRNLIEIDRKAQQYERINQNVRKCKNVGGCADMYFQVAT